MDFLLGILFAKIFLGNSSSYQKPASKQADSNQPKQKIRHRHLTQAEWEQRSIKQSRQALWFCVFTAPLVFCTTTIAGGVFLTNFSCSFDQQCVELNLEQNTYNFALNHVSSIQHPIATSKLFPLPLLPAYWLILFSYCYLFLVFLCVLTILIDGLSFIGAKAWQWAITDSSKDES